MKGRQSVDEYLKNGYYQPHATIIYTNPEASQSIYSRAGINYPMAQRNSTSPLWSRGSAS